MLNPGRVDAIEYQKDVEVDGSTYCVHLLSPSKALKLSFKLTKLVGEPMAQMANASQGKDVAELLPIAVRALLSRLDENEVLGIIKEMVATCTLENKPINFEDSFQGRLGHLVKLVAKVMEVQFSDFFAGLAETLGQTMGLRAQE
jgi:hypothetical protein